MNEVKLSGKVLRLGERFRVTDNNEDGYTCYRVVSIIVENYGEVYLFVTGEIMCERLSSLYSGEEIEVTGELSNVAWYARETMVRITYLKEINPKPKEGTHTNPNELRWK